MSKRPGVVVFDKVDKLINHGLLFFQGRPGILHPSPGFYLLGAGGSIPPNVSSSPTCTPEKKFFLKKNLKLFQILILFDEDIKELVKATNVLKCNFSQS